HGVAPFRPTRSCLEWTRRKQEGMAKKQIQARAAHWYKQALPGLSGLVKEKVEVRLRQTEPNGKAAFAHKGNSKSKLIDLLADVDVKRDSYGGEWVKTAQGITTSTPDNRFMFAQAVEGSYDLKIGFTPQGQGRNEFHIVLPVGSHDICVVFGGWNAQASALEYIDGKSGEHNETNTGIRLVFVPQQRYDIGVSVRQIKGKAAIVVSLNGKRIIAWNGNESSLTCPHFARPPQSQRIGILVGPAEVNSALLLFNRQPTGQKIHGR
ncbi:MAG: hypothetical protein WCJ35_23435, partial [Planctomycetota bacterium]